MASSFAQVLLFGESLLNLSHPTSHKFKKGLINNLYKKVFFTTDRNE